MFVTRSAWSGVAGRMTMAGVGVRAGVFRRSAPMQGSTGAWDFLYESPFDM